jgi:hypothetical protein
VQSWPKSVTVGYRSRSCSTSPHDPRDWRASRGDRCGLSAGQGDRKHVGNIPGNRSRSASRMMTAGDRVIARARQTYIRALADLDPISSVVSRRFGARPSRKGHHRDRWCSNGIPTSSCARIDVSSAKPTRGDANSARTSACFAILNLSRISGTDAATASDQAVRRLFEHATLVSPTVIASLRLRLLRSARCSMKQPAMDHAEKPMGTANDSGGREGARYSSCASSRCGAAFAKHHR